MDVLNLNSLPILLTEWSEVQLKYFVEGLSVGLERQNKCIGDILKVTGDEELEFELIWETCSQKIHKSWKEPKKIAEAGATAMAFLLCEKLTEFIPTCEAVIGTGVDYWLGYKEGHEKYSDINFINARLEISGINQESKTNTVENRVKVKNTQVTQSDKSKLPVYISVTEFSIPKSYFYKK